MLTVLHMATINQPVKPDLGYGPIEMVIHNIDQGLHALGYRSIVACSGDSEVAGEHYVTVEKSIGDYWTDNTVERRKTMDLHLARSLDRAMMGDIDVIHVHDIKAVEYIYDAAAGMQVPIVLTLHVAARDYLMAEAGRRRHKLLSSPLVHCVPISEYQKIDYQGLQTENVVHHGIAVENYPVKKNPDPASYLFTIGRITRDKGQDKAIEIAKRTGAKLIIAGCVQDKTADRDFFASLKDSIDLFVDVGKQPVDRDYYELIIKPLLDSDKQIIYIGEISSAHKKQWYLHALATLFPIQWGEPFGLVLIESMACGTPAIAFRKGSVPEIIVHGKTGFVVDSPSAMIEALKHIDSIDPYACRRHVHDHFSITSMAYKYSELYQHIVIDHKIPGSYSRPLTGYLQQPPRHGSLAI